jgi:hypothetical protein
MVAAEVTNVDIDRPILKAVLSIIPGDVYTFVYVPKLQMRYIYKSTRHKHASKVHRLENIRGRHRFTSVINGGGRLSDLSVEVSDKPPPNVDHPLE